MATDMQDDPLYGSRYRALRLLGRGGMGAVYEAEHIALGSHVALKVLHVEISAKKSLDDRFRVEAQTLACVESANLIKVSDFGRLPDGRAFYCMELLKGRSLREELELRGALPIPEAIAITRQILLGLGAAHRAGVIHRDVKPDNVFLCDPGADGKRVVKVLDFGIAKVLGTNAAGPAPIAVPTAEGVIVGTPRYLAPEQALGQTKKISERSDIYGVGIVLYALVAGRGPFSHVKGMLEILKAQISIDPEPPSRFATQTIPKSLDTAILRALAREPEGRFPSAEAFIEALDRIAAEVAGGVEQARATPKAPTAADLPTAMDRPVEPLAPPPAPRVEGAPTLKERAKHTKAARPPADRATFLGIAIASAVVFTAILVGLFRVFLR